MAIKIDPAKLEKEAERVSDLANNMGRDAGLGLERVAENIKAGWTGESAKVYSKYIDAASETIHKYATTLNEHADTMKNIANAVRRADEQARQQAAK